MDVKNYLPTTFKHLTSIVCLCLFVTACGNNDEDEAVNNVPTAEAQTVTTDEDVALDITLSANDADGDALTYAITNPAHGVISGTARYLTYTPNTN